MKNVGGGVAGVIGVVATLVNIQACIDEGNSKAWCAAELGVTVVGGGLVVAGLAAVGVPAAVLAGGGAVLVAAGGVAAGNRWAEAPEVKAEREKQAAQAAQTEKRFKNVLSALREKKNYLKVWVRRLIKL